MNYRLVNSEEKLVTLASRPDFLSTNVFTENLVGVRLCKSKVTLDKPMYIGQTVLELQVGDVRIEVRSSTPLRT